MTAPPRAASPAVVGVLLAGGRVAWAAATSACDSLARQPSFEHVGRARASAGGNLGAQRQRRPRPLRRNRTAGRGGCGRGFCRPARRGAHRDGMARTQRPDCPWIATIATDTPFFPADLVARMLGVVEHVGAELACASSGGRAHPVFGLWPVRLADELRAAMIEEGIRKVDVWTARHGLVEVPFATDPVDPFFNTNRPEDLAEAERLLRAIATEPRRRFRPRSGSLWTVPVAWPPRSGEAPARARSPPGPHGSLRAGPCAPQRQRPP